MHGWSRTEERPHTQEKKKNGGGGDEGGNKTDLERICLATHINGGIDGWI